MPCKSKKACQAEAQRASGTQFFNAGFTDTIDKHINDPSYNMLGDHDIDQSDSNEDLAFSFLGCRIAEDEG